MERKVNEQEIKDSLLKKLQAITLSENEIEIVVKCNDGKVINLKKNEIKRFGFEYGDFIQIIFGCPCHRQNEIALCVGVGVGCPQNRGMEDLWFLIGQNAGVSHFCEAQKRDFEQKEIDDVLIRL